jgi:SAM-dependent methyltransferase
MTDNPRLTPKQLDIVGEIFGTTAIQNDGNLTIGGNTWPVIDGVIILDGALGTDESAKAEVIRSFGNEWESFSGMAPEHQQEFDSYFDHVDLPALAGKTAADLGCGMGRWSRILLERTQPRLLVCVDLSDAIFVARRNLAAHDNIVFIKADLEKLSFDRFRFDFAFSLGVLHHIPGGIDRALARIAGYCDSFLGYLYYALDNRGVVFATLFRAADLLRRGLNRVRSEPARRVVSWLLALFLYKPFTLLADLAGALGVNKERMPLNAYCGNSLHRIQQDAYDRFFTTVEHRYSRAQIREACGRYWQDITFSDRQPFWHFLCRAPRRQDS